MRRLDPGDQLGRYKILKRLGAGAMGEVYLAEETDPSWGPNLLPEPLFPGDELIITDIDCGTYDALVVDETGVECELSGIDLCLGDSDGWVIDNFTLDVCAFGG